MSDNSSDILIQIRTALESGGLDSAKAKLSELTGQVAASSAGMAANSKVSAEATEKIRGMREVVAGLSHSFENGTFNVRGFAEGVRGLHDLLPGLATALANVAAVGASLGAGMQLGHSLDEAFHISDKLGTSLGNLRTPLDNATTSSSALKAEFDALNQVSLDAIKQKLEDLKKEIEDISSGFDAFSRRTSDATKESIAKRDATMAPGRERDLADQADRFRSESKQAVADAGKALLTRDADRKAGAEELATLQKNADISKSSLDKFTASGSTNVEEGKTLRTREAADREALDKAIAGTSDAQKAAKKAEEDYQHALAVLRTAGWNNDIAVKNINDKYDAEEKRAKEAEAQKAARDQEKTDKAAIDAQNKDDKVTLEAARAAEKEAEKKETKLAAQSQADKDRAEVFSPHQANRAEAEAIKADPAARKLGYDPTTGAWAGTKMGGNAKAADEQDKKLDQIAASSKAIADGLSRKISESIQSQGDLSKAMDNLVAATIENNKALMKKMESITNQLKSSTP